jgi:hypothetical protein
MVDNRQNTGSNNTEAELLAVLNQLHQKPSRGAGIDDRNPSPELFVVFEQLKGSFGSGSSRFTKKLWEDIATRESVKQEIERFPLDIRSHLEEKLKQKIDSKKSDLKFIPGSGNSFFFVLLLILTAESGIFPLDIPNTVMLVVLFSVIIGFPLRVLLVRKVQRLAAMVHCLDLAQQ